MSKPRKETHNGETALQRNDEDEFKEARLDAFKQRLKGWSKPPKLVKNEGSEENVVHCEKPSDLYAILTATGTGDFDLSFALTDQAAKTISSFSKPIEAKCNIALAALHGIKPRDELEGMLAVQMVGTHNLAMTFLARSIVEDQTFDGANACISRATKLMRTFTAQVEALNRYRGHGQQKVVVEHVHVNEGGQAIVGNVEGGGDKHGNVG